jgi:CheY-like chemotaxis protein
MSSFAQADLWLRGPVDSFVDSHEPHSRHLLYLMLSSRPAPDRKRKIRVLLIEDDPVISEMYRVQLEYDGYEVSVAATGRSGFGMATSSPPPDIVLLDILLPDWNGFEVMAELNELPEAPPVVLLSNYGDPAMVHRGTVLGALDYLVKSRVDPALVSLSIPGWIEKSDRGRATDG